MQADCLRVVVDGDVHMSADGLLDASAGTSAAGKQVDYQLVRDGEDELLAQHGSGSRP